MVLTRGTLRSRADRIVVRQDAEGFQFATATGKPVRFRQRQDPKPPEKEGTWMEGEAMRIEIDDRKPARSSCSTTRASTAAATRSRATT